MHASHVRHQRRPGEAANSHMDPFPSMRRATRDEFTQESVRLRAWEFPGHVATQRPLPYKADAEEGISPVAWAGTPGLVHPPVWFPSER